MVPIGSNFLRKKIVRRKEAPLPNRLSRRDLLAGVTAEMPGQAAAAVRLNIAVAHQLGMPLADVQCMGLLVNGQSAPSQLAASLGLTTGAVTKVLDWLERAGYIVRSADPSDRRRIVVSVDPAGLAALTRYFAPMGEKMSAHLASYTATELATILRFMRAGHQAADEEIARVREQGIHHATRRGHGAV
jgi:DNA-binding MarR family transcriptional regulator